MFKTFRQALINVAQTGREFTSVDETLMKP